MDDLVIEKIQYYVESNNLIFEHNKVLLIFDPGNKNKKPILCNKFVIDKWNFPLPLPTDEIIQNISESDLKLNIPYFKVPIVLNQDIKRLAKQENGQLIFNATINKIQIYLNNEWITI